MIYTLSLKFAIKINRFLTIQTHIEYEIIVCENRFLFSQEICSFFFFIDIICAI